MEYSSASVANAPGKAQLFMRLASALRKLVIGKEPIHIDRIAHHRKAADRQEQVDKSQQQPAYIIVDSLSFKLQKAVSAYLLLKALSVPSDFSCSRAT